jgi:hypothetical protein
MDTGQTSTTTAPKLVGLSAAIVPWRPEFYQGGATQVRVLGVPVVTIAGVASTLAGSFVWWLHLHSRQFGVSSKANMFEWGVGRGGGGSDLLLPGPLDSTSTQRGQT